MVFKIIWTIRAYETFEDNIQYLLDNWSEKELENYKKLVKNKIDLLRIHPELGRPFKNRSMNIRQIVIHRRILLLYKVSDKSQEIKLLLFWNTLKNPRKLKL